MEPPDFKATLDSMEPPVSKAPTVPRASRATTVQMAPTVLRASRATLARSVRKDCKVRRATRATRDLRASGATTVPLAPMAPTAPLGLREILVLQVARDRR